MKIFSANTTSVSKLSNFSIISTYKICSLKITTTDKWGAVRISMY